MSGVWIRKRPVPAGKRNPKPRTSYQVLYRRGGRYHKVRTAGTFKTQAEARTRRDVVAGWLAAGLDPAEELAKIAAAETVQRKTAARWRDDWLTSRHDLGDKSVRAYRNGIDAVISRLDSDDLHQVDVADCLRVVGELTAKYAVATVHSYWTAFEQLLDYVGVDPNPARDKRIKLPKLKRTPPTVPTAPHVETMLKRIAAKYRLPMVTIEQTAMRVESVEELTWGGTDVTGCRLRLFEKGGKYRWAPIPRWLMDLLELTCEVEDRVADRRLFPGITPQGLRAAMATACKLGKIPHYHPHDLRHRRASLWHLQNVPDAVLADLLGHDKASFSKDVYAHVMPVDEIAADRLEALVKGDN